MEEATRLPEPGSMETRDTPVLRQIPRKQKRMRPIPLGVRLALALGLCVALVLCRVLWRDSAVALRRWIVGDGSEQVQQAFFSMERTLEDGGGLGDAWTAFCAELTDEEA